MTEEKSYSDNAEALYSICLLAAFADGNKDAVEREELKKIGETMLPEELHPAAVYQKVLLGKTDAASEAARLETKEWRQLAYEMAVKVCEADGVTQASERAFLQELAGHLEIPAEEAGLIIADADQMGAASLDEVDPALLPPPLPAGPSVKDEVDSLIMRYSIINGALELLPETLSTMAIIPLQMKLVNSVGKHHGVSMDRQQLVEFLGAAGIGATSQVVEGMARKMIGGLTGKLGKKFLGKSFGGFAKKGVDQLTSSAFSFASTWAIGQLAQRYYSNGRSWSGINAREAYQSLRQRAEPLHQEVLPEIQREASVLDYKKVLSMVRG